MASLKPRELSDEEVFGAAKRPGEMTDAEVFGPPTQPPAAHWAKISKPNPYAGKSLDDLKTMYRAPGGANRATMDAYVAKEAKEGGFGYALDDVIRQAAKGVPILGGAADEINAGIASLTGQSGYDEALEYNRARDRYRETLNPETSTAVQIGGGVAGTLAGARALGVPYGANSTTPIFQRALTGGAVTAPVVGADAFLRAEGGLENRATQGGIGAAIGFPLGAVAPVVAQGLSSGVQRLANFLTSDQALRQLGISRNAANVLLRQLGTDDTLTATGAARIREAGPNAMVADAGPAARNLLDTALERSGPGSTAAREAVEQRAMQANRDLRGTLDTTMGAPVGVETRQAGIRAGTAQARQQAYDAAYSQPIDYAAPAGRQIDDLLGRVPQEAITHANRLMRAEGQQSRQIMARVNPDGTVTYERLPDVRQLDYITRALNEVAQGAEGQGAMRGTTALGRVYGDLSRQLRQNLRQAVPAYGQALDTAADPIRRIQATEFGATILDRGVTREQVAREIAGMSAAERQAAIRGMRDQIDEVAANVKAMASDPNIDARQLREVLGSLTSQASGDKIAAVLGPAATRQFMGRVREAMRAMELRASVARNSRTFGRTATDAQVRAQLEPGVIGTAMEGRPLDAARQFLQGLTGMTPERRLALEDRLYGEIANALTRVRGRQAEQYLRQLERALRARSQNTRTGQAVGTLGADAYLGATVPASTSPLRPAQP